VPGTRVATVSPSYLPEAFCYAGLYSNHSYVCLAWQANTMDRHSIPHSPHFSYWYYWLIIGYEIMKLGLGHISKRVVRILLAPGLMLQAMTTEEPDANQREAAILALNEVIEIDKATDSSYSA
jgi:hypothetical protein